MAEGEAKRIILRLFEVPIDVSLYIFICLIRKTEISVTLSLI